MSPLPQEKSNFCHQGQKSESREIHTNNPCKLTPIFLVTQNNPYIEVACFRGTQSAILCTHKLKCMR